MASRIGAAALVGLMAFTVTACGGDDEPKKAASDKPTVAESATTEAAAEISDDCKLAVLNWADIANKQTADLAFGAPDNAGDPGISTHTNEIQTYCSSADLNEMVADINYRLALGEAQITAGKDPSEDVAAATLTNNIAAVTDLVK